MPSLPSREQKRLLLFLLYFAPPRVPDPFALSPLFLVAGGGGDRIVDPRMVDPRIVDPRMVDPKES